MPRYQIGRKGRVYVAAEASYGVAPGFAATDAVRHLNVALNRKSKNRVNAPTRHVHPDLVYRRDRRGTGSWSLRGEFFPSGTLNTLPDHTDVLEHGIGSKTNVTLNTTIAVGGAGTTTADTFTSGAGLAVGDAVLFHHQDGNKYVRFLTAINAGTGVATWAPALPAALSDGQAVKGCVTYKLATDLAKSLNIGHYLEDLSYQGYGAVVDQLKIMFDANNEVMWEASGPMKSRSRNADTADPSVFTTAGTGIPSGLTGELRFNGSVEDYLRAEFAIANAMELDNFAGGTSVARGFYRKGKRAMTVGLDTMVSDDTTIIAVDESHADATVLVQSGDTEGQIVAVYCPLVEFDEPDDPNSDEELEWKHQGVAKSTIAGNDGFYLAVA